MMKFKKGDTVKITAGKDRDREGKIERIFPKKGTVLVPGINIFKKHFKGNQGQKSGIYGIPKPIGLAKLVLICPKCKKTTRVGWKILGKVKPRICKKCGKEVDVK
jgi:large subunit ribosomal protein L24